MSLLIWIFNFSLNLIRIQSVKIDSFHIFFLLSLALRGQTRNTTFSSLDPHGGLFMFCQMTYFQNTLEQKGNFFVLQSQWINNDWCQGPPQLINNISVYDDVIWILQSGNMSQKCGFQAQLDCSDARICTSIIDTTVFIELDLANRETFVERSEFEETSIWRLDDSCTTFLFLI